jgi:undecaprenyl-diphosphatase
MLRDHRRALWYASALLAATILVLAAVGRHPPRVAPQTTLSFVGGLDASLYRLMHDIRTPALTWLFRALNVLGGGVVTIPLRVAVSIWLAARTLWRRFFAFVFTWAASEILLTSLKTWFHRGRPSGALVDTVGFSFPSGHAVAGAALAVALVLAFFPQGPRRRKWEWLAAGFAFVMALSRVYLLAHWFSDVVAGVMLGSGIAIGSAALVTEIRDVWLRREMRRRADAASRPPARS